MTKVGPHTVHLFSFRLAKTKARPGCGAERLSKNGKEEENKKQNAA